MCLGELHTGLGAVARLGISRQAASPPACRWLTAEAMGADCGDNSIISSILTVTDWEKVFMIFAQR